MELKAVIQGCLEQRPGAWDMLVTAYSRKILSMAFQFCGSYSEAEDMTQEIFLKVYNSLARFDPEKNFTAWLLALAKNHLIDEYRRTKWEKRNREDFEDHVHREISHLPGPEDQALEAENRKTLWKGLNRLAPDMRLAIILKEIQGKSYDEVASVLNLPLGTVKSRINRGKLMLAKILRQSQEARHDA